METKIKNIDFWKDAKSGDVFELEVASGSNDWIFSKPVYFDRIAYPNDEMKKYFDGPSIIFQKNKEDIGNKSKGYPINLSDIKKIKTINNEFFNSKDEKKKQTAKTKDEIINTMINNFTIEKTVYVEKYGFNVMKIGDKWACPCYNPINPNKYTYSIKANAVFFHRKHIKNQ